MDRNLMFCFFFLPFIGLLVFYIFGIILLLCKYSNLKYRKFFLRLCTKPACFVLVISFCFQFAFIKTLSEVKTKTISFYESNTSYKIITSECTLEVFDNRENKITALKKIIPERFIFNRDQILEVTPCISKISLPEITDIMTVSSKYPDFYFRISNKYKDYKKTNFREIANLETVDVTKNSYKSDVNEPINSYEFIFSIAFYCFLSLAFFLAVSKYWYESSSSLYRHFNDKFVDQMLIFNNANGFEVKKAHAERLFQLLKEEYLIFYKHNYVYGLNQKELIATGNLKFWKNNILYVAGTNEYLDEWFTMMINVSCQIQQNKLTTSEVKMRLSRTDGKLESYFLYLYLERKDLEDSEENNDPSFLKFIEKAKDIAA